MSGISTKGVQKSYVSKEIKPGNSIAKVNKISIEESKTPRDPNNPEFKIWIELETKPVGGDFVGFDKVFGDPSSGQYQGQIKKIQYSNWALKDAKGVSKATGKPYEILASSQILNFLQKLLTSVGEKGWLEANDGKFQTWTEMFSGINRAGLLKDKFLSWCIGGTESINPKGYTVYYMYLPDRKQAQEPFGPEGSLVTQFDPAKHIKQSAKMEENAELNATDTAYNDDSVSTNTDSLGDFATGSDTDVDDDPFDMED